MSGFIIMVGLLVYCAWLCVPCFDSFASFFSFTLLLMNCFNVFFFFCFLSLGVLGPEDRRRGVDLFGN